jgi:hypothetical protein
MDKNIFASIEPDYEPLTEREASDILASAIGKLNNANRESANAHGRSHSSTREYPIEYTPQRRRGRNGKRIFLVAIAAVLVFSIVAYASTVINPDSPLLSYFGIDGNKPNGEEIRIAQDSSTIIDKFVENNGVTVHVKEAIGDRSTFYILFDVIAPKGVLKQGMQYHFENFDLSRKSLLTGVPLGSRGWSYHFSEPDEEGIVHIIAEASSDHQIDGKTVTLELKNLQRELTDEEIAQNIDHGDGESDEDTTAETVVEGIWKVSFKLDYRNNSRNLGIYKNLTVNGKTYILSDVWMSPLSLSLKANGDFALLDGELPTIIKMKNGRTFDVIADSLSSSWGDDGSGMKGIFEFPKIIDVTQVESISFGDYTHIVNK